MSKTKTKKSAPDQKLSDFLEVVWCILCSHVVESVDGSVTLVEVRESVYVRELPAKISAKKLVICLHVRSEIPINSKLRVEISSPSGEGESPSCNLDLKALAVGFQEHEQAGSTIRFARMIVGLPRWDISEEGEYEFTLSGTAGAKWEKLHKFVIQVVSGVEEDLT